MRFAYCNVSKLPFNRSLGVVVGEIVAVLLLGLWSGCTDMQECAPGQVNCDETAPTIPLVSNKVTQDTSIAAEGECVLTGRWFNRFGCTMTISPSLQGSLRCPYCPLPLIASLTPRGTIGVDLNAVWIGGFECQSFSEELTFQSCFAMSGPFTNANGGGGSDSWQKNEELEAEITASPPIIPSESRVISRHVRTVADLRIIVTRNGDPVSGVSISLESDRGAADTITEPSAATDWSGVTIAQVETRTQPGSSMIKATNVMTKTAPIYWLPAKFEHSFLVTCYAISQESRFRNTPLISVNGLPANKQYRQGFINDVRTQGSGLAEDGTVIHYDHNNHYSIQSCAITASGICAVDGNTAAVDPNVIPLRSTVSIDTVGARVGNDTGGLIQGLHIDEYFGPRYDECLQAARRQLAVEFEHY